MNIIDSVAKMMYKEFGEGYPPTAFSKLKPQEKERYLKLAKRINKAYKNRVSF